MSQSSTLPQDEQQHWLDNCLPLIRESQPMFVDPEDASALHETEQALRESDANKLKELDSVRDRLRALSRQAETHKLAAQRPTGAPSEKQHETRLAELEGKKYGLVKTIADLDGAISTAEMQLSKHKESASKEEKQDVAPNVEAELHTQLKLQLYRTMGLLPIEEDGAYSRILISSGAQASTLPSNSGASRFDNVQRAWSTFV